MRTWIKCLLATLALVGGSAAFAVGGGGGPMPSGGDVGAPRTQSPQDKARTAYNSGVRAVKKADKLAANPKKADKATDQYARARDLFEDAVTHDPNLHQAWNYLGYTRRKLGSYEAALAAYDRALTLKPDYVEAMEYRGEAYLRLKRLDDAKNAYLELFARDRKLADQLLASMKNWVQEQRASASSDVAGLDAFDQWVQERSQIAGQTAALTREGASASLW